MSTLRSTSSRSSIFLGCFGYSGDKMQAKDKVNPTSRRRRWLFGCKKSSVKSVHVDFTVTPTDKKHVATTSEEQKTCRKSWTDVVKGQKTQPGSFRSRRKDEKPAAGGREIKKTVTVGNSYPFVSSPMKALTKSKCVDGGVGKQVERKTTPSGGEFDSIIAMLILLAIMVIMMLWGKLCAIFCTCAWFCIAPRVMAAGGGATAEKSPELVNDININMNLESVEYKKKVVLEGLLQRNHRNVVGTIYKL